VSVQQPSQQSKAAVHCKAAAQLALKQAAAKQRQGSGQQQQKQRKAKQSSGEES
jgi:hypothetical protein